MCRYPQQWINLYKAIIVEIEEYSKNLDMSLLVMNKIEITQIIDSISLHNPLEMTIGTLKVLINKNMTIFEGNEDAIITIISFFKCTKIIKLYIIIKMISTIVEMRDSLFIIGYFKKIDTFLKVLNW